LYMFLCYKGKNTYKQYKEYIKILIIRGISILRILLNSRDFSHEMNFQL
jgi:hypothetical protein